MRTETPPTPLAPAIRSMLRSLRLRILGYVWGEGLALAIAWLGVAFWVSLALDWSIEPPVLVRQILLGIAVVGLLVVLVRAIFRRIFKSIADHNLALLIERRFGQFKDSLITTVELAEQPAHSRPFNPALLAQTEAAAVQRLSAVRLGRVFRRGPLVRGIAAALLAVASIAAFVVWAPDATHTWLQRNLEFSDILWPRRTHLVLDGFGPDKRVKVAKGSDLTIVAKADTNYEVPDTLQIRYRTDDGRGRENMSQVGHWKPGDKFQPFQFAFRGILTSRTFDVVGGDFVLRDYAIDVVDVPTIRMTLHCDYPPYTGREPSDRPVSGQVQLPQGSKLTIHAEANKDLVEVPIQRTIGDKSESMKTVQFAAEADRRSFSFVIPRLDQNQDLLFNLLDADGIRSREPIRLNITATPDEPPRVGLHLRGIGQAITPNARLPWEGEITDDWGVAALWFEYAVDQEPPKREPLRLKPNNRTLIKLDRDSDEALDLRNRNLKVGQQLFVSVVAQDNCALQGGPNTGPGERFQLSVVSPEQLLSKLEARELDLRMRLEVVAREVSDARGRLADVDLGPVKKDEKAKPAPGAEPGDTADSGGEHRAAPAVVVEQAVQNLPANISDINSIATGFDDIREELANNRIDTPQLEYRLKDQIGVPLRGVADKMIPELDARLKKLQSALADQGAGARRDDAVRQYDAILVQIRLVLNKMLEMESFNEVVQRLRDIIDAEQKLHGDTQEQQRREVLKQEE